MRIIVILMLAGAGAALGADPGIGRSPFNNRLGTNLPSGFTNRPGYTNLVKPDASATNRFGKNLRSGFTNGFGPADTNRGALPPGNPFSPPNLTPPANPPPNPAPPPNIPLPPPGNPQPPSNIPLAPPKPLAPPGRL